MFTVKRFKFVSRPTLFNPAEFFAVVFLFSRHLGSFLFFATVFELFLLFFLSSILFLPTDQR